MNFTIDYAAHLIQFNASEALLHSAPLAPGDRVALVDSHVLGRVVRLKVDTGFNSLLLYGNHIQGRVQTVDTGARVAGVPQGSSVLTASSEVRVGNWRTSHMTVAVLQTAPRDLTLYDGLLGPRLLGAKRVAFDFDHCLLSWD